MAKFKKGDRIRIIETYVDYFLGQVGVVSEDYDGYVPKCTINGERIHVIDDHMELIEDTKVNKFKVGDKVTNTTTAGFVGIPVGSIGFVEREPVHTYGVRFPLSQGGDQLLDWDESVLTVTKHTITLEDGRHVELSEESYRQFEDVAK